MPCSQKRKADAMRYPWMFRETAKMQNIIRSNVNFNVSIVEQHLNKTKVALFRFCFCFGVTSQLRACLPLRERTFVWSNQGLSNKTGSALIEQFVLLQFCGSILSIVF